MQLSPSLKTQPASAQQSVGVEPLATPEYRMVGSLPVASLLALTGGSLDAFLYLNHGHVYAGVMSGNAVLCGVAVFNHSVGSAFHYAWPIIAYVVGIFLIAMMQRNVRHHSARLALIIVMVGFLIMSLCPSSFPERPFVFIVVVLTGFLVGISQKVESYAYNATVLTGSLRDGTISVYKMLNPVTRFGNLEKARDLWMIMFFFVAGAAAGGVLGRHIGNHALWLPIGVLAIVLGFVLRSGSSYAGFDGDNKSGIPVRSAASLQPLEHSADQR